MTTAEKIVELRPLINSMKPMIHTMINMGAMLERSTTKDLQHVQVEEGYASFQTLLEVPGPTGVRVISAYATAGTIGYWHDHDVDELVIVYKGTVQYEYVPEDMSEFVELSVGGNQIFSFPKNVKHKPVFPEECCAICILIPDDPQLGG